ncbi:FkbM family methyltransferase [Sphingomonas ginkgonis]|uniref:FkbM family methyltransferase n=1 Tax=Sphingomonas ginkgonis TaxID=2315330 RepID=A0A3S0ELK1_9SPHN|nr:FkbM family methyltransferase [Sphingomonas ginkgonis]RST30381.1 FkbM family methyltransferase [Sphingomonas ginkgonis]
MTFVSYAQNFEDVVLWRALKDIEGGSYLDIGAQDPEQDSVSLAFYERGWRGVHVEPTPAYARQLRNSRPDETVIEAACSCAPGPIRFFEFPTTGLSTSSVEIAEHHSRNGFEGRSILVPTVRLDGLYETIKTPTHWLKIDVEGAEADVLASWGDHGARPWIIAIEATFPSTRRPTHEAWEHQLRNRGYSSVYFDGLSRYYLHEEQAERASAFQTPPNVFDSFLISRSHFSAALLNNERSDAVSIATTASAEERRGLKESNNVLQSRVDELESARAELLGERQAALSRVQELENSCAGMAAAQQALEAERADLQELAAEASTEKAVLLTQIDGLFERLAAAVAEGASARAASDVALAEQDQLRALLTSAREEERRALHEHLAMERRHCEQLDAVRGKLVDTLKEHGDAREDVARLAAELEQMRAHVLTAARLVRAGSEKPRSGWHPLRPRSRSASHIMFALENWAKSISEHHPPQKPPFPVQTSHDQAMTSYLDQEYGNPYLRADSLAELVSWNDIDFVRCAYVTVLGRQPDQVGELYYTRRIREGYSKLETLWQLRKSAEARSHDPGIAGFDRALRSARWARSPFGWLVRMITGGESNSAAWKRHRILLNEIYRSEARQAAHGTADLRNMVQGLSTELQSLSENVRELVARRQAGEAVPLLEDDTLSIQDQLSDVGRRIFQRLV